MLKEERRLRQSTLVCTKPCAHCKGISKEIKELVQAVQENCAKVAENGSYMHGPTAHAIAAAIRGKK